MKHAGAETLKTVDPVLRQIRKHDALIEKTPGSFYLRSKAFLHFHEDRGGIFVDLKENLFTFTRYRATTRGEQRKLLNRVERCLKRQSAKLAKSRE
jgi:hexokinase